MSSSGNVDLQFTASDRAAVAAWQSQQRLADNLIRKLEKIEKLSSRAPSSGGMSSGRFLEDQTRRMASFILGGVGVAATLRKMTEAGREFSEQSLEASKGWDKVFREFQGQSGLRGQAANLAEKQIRDIARETSLPVEEVAAAATQMVSSGFSPQESTGGALREQLRGMLATNIVGKEQIKIDDIIRASASYLAAQGLDKNELNTRDINARIATLYKTTNMQFGDFMEFARESVGMKGTVDIGTQLASISSLVDVMSAAEASTGLRNVVGRMRTVRGTPEKTEGLKMLGLNPEEIDLVGEDFISALKKINEGVKRAKPEDVPIALKKIFEEKGINIAQPLLNSVSLIEQRVKEQLEGADQFLKDAKFAQEGLNAALRRQESERKEFLSKSPGAANEVMFAEAKQFMLEKGFSPFRADANLFAAQSMSYLTGMPAEMALAGALDFDPKGLSIVQSRTQAKMEGTNISPKKIEENMRKEPEKKLVISPQQAAIFEQARAEFRDPMHMFRNTKLNPWYDRSGRYPKEDAVRREVDRIQRDVSGRVDAFGSLTSEESKEFKNRASDALRKANNLGVNVHSYDIQLILTQLADALDRNTAATQGNTKANGGDTSQEPRPVYRPATQGQQRGGGL